MRDNSFRNNNELFRAIHLKEFDRADRALSDGADANAKDPEGDTALHLAAATGQMEIVALLIDKGADVNTGNSEGQTALHWATAIGQMEIATFLIDKGADVNAGDENGVTPLHRAATHSQMEIAGLLIDKGAVVDVKDKDGWTPLHNASATDLPSQRETAKFLIDRGASNPENSDGQTPGDLAVKSLLRRRRAEDSNALNPKGIREI